VPVTLAAHLRLGLRPCPHLSPKGIEVPASGPIYDFVSGLMYVGRIETYYTFMDEQPFRSQLVAY
jgi:hypothetical protein